MLYGSITCMKSHMGTDDELLPVVRNRVMMSLRASIIVDHLALRDAVDGKSVTILVQRPGMQNTLSQAYVPNFRRN